jgi:hypothetical protein
MKLLRCFLHILTKTVLNEWPFDVITSLVSLEHGVYGWENVTSQRDTRSNVGVTSLRDISIVLIT